MNTSGINATDVFKLSCKPILTYTSDVMDMKLLGKLSSCVRTDEVILSCKRCSLQKHE